MVEKDILNSMLDKHLKLANKPKWRINLEAICLIALYLAIFPGILVYLFWTGHWIFGTIWIIPTFMGLGVAIGGKKFGFWLINTLTKFKK